MIRSKLRRAALALAADDVIVTINPDVAGELKCDANVKVPSVRSARVVCFRLNALVGPTPTCARPSSSPAPSRRA